MVVSFLVLVSLDSVLATNIFFDGFESGNLNGWTLTHASGANDWIVSTVDPYSGSYHAQVYPQSTIDPASIMNKSISTVGYQNISISYYRKLNTALTHGFNSKWFDGNTWITLESTLNANDASYVYKTFNLSSNANNNPNFRISVDCTSGTVSQYCRVDDVNISGNLIDTTPPSFSNYIENPLNNSAYSQGQFYEFNVTITEPNLATVKINFNGTNYTNVYARGGGVYSFNRTDLSAGTYSYYWWANDTNGNSNSSVSRDYVVAKASGSITLLLNGNADNISLTYSQQLNASAYTVYGTVTLYRNGSNVTSQNSSNITLGVGYYNYTAVSSGDQNYSSPSITYWLNITKANSEIYLYLNGSRANITLAEGDSILINSTIKSGEGDIYIYNNGSLIYQGGSPSSNLTNFAFPGLYNITAIYQETQNYTSSSETWWANVTSYPSITIFIPQNTVYTYNESLLLNFSVFDQDGNLDSCWYNLNNGENITISGCQNTTFNVSSGEGSYTLTVYVNDTLGLESNDSVNFNVDLTGILISISQPSGTKTSRTGIPINYVAQGNNLTCWYNVKTSIGGEVIGNTTLPGCNSSSFDVSNDGDYVFWIFANNSLGTFNSSSSTFTINTSPPPSSSSSSSSGGGGGGGGAGVGVPKLRPSLSVGEISDILVNKGGVKKVLSWKVKNNGTSFLNNCNFKSTGTYSSWITYTETKGLAAGQEYTFVFDVNIPEEIETGDYLLGVSLICKETNASTSFSVQVSEKKLDFAISDVSRNNEESIKVKYSIEDISGEDQNVELQFLLFDLNGRQVAGSNESKTINANTKQEFETIIPIDKTLKGELNLLANLNSETFSTFVQESVVLGSPISGFTIFDRIGGTNNVVSIILVILFLGFAFFIVKRIRSHRERYKVHSFFKDRAIKRERRK